MCFGVRSLALSAKVIKTLLVLVRRRCNFHCVAKKPRVCSRTPFQATHTHTHTCPWVFLQSQLFFLCGLAFCTYTNRISGHQCWKLLKNTRHCISVAAYTGKHFHKKKQKRFCPKNKAQNTLLTVPFNWSHRVFVLCLLVGRYLQKLRR